MCVLDRSSPSPSPLLLPLPLPLMVLDYGGAVWLGGKGEEKEEEEEGVVRVRCSAAVWGKEDSFGEE